MSDVADRAAEQFLTAAYPDEHQRGHAERWLGLLACQADDGQVHWWEIPALAPALAVLTARRLVLGLLAASVIGWGIYVGITQPETTGVYVVILGLAGRLAAPRFGASLRHPPARLRPGLPGAIRPRWLRGRTEYRQLLFGGLLLGLGILPVLVRQWRVRAIGHDAPAATYRADRIACLVTGLAWAPVGVLLGALPAWGTGALPEVVAAHVVVAAVWGALLSGPYPLVKLSEVVMSADWEDRVRFLPLLEDAADRGVLRRAAGGYEFRDDALRARLITSGRAALSDHAELRARRLAGRGIRAAAVRYLTRRGKIRVYVDFTVGAAAAAATGIPTTPGGAPSGWLLIPAKALLGVVLGALAGGVMMGVLVPVAGSCKMTLTYLPRLSGRGRIGWVVVAAVAAAALIAEEGTVLAEIIAYVLPAVLVMACGTWACMLAFRRTRAFRRRWQRAAPDVIAAATTGATLLLLLDHRLLTALPAAGLLFPAAVWGSFVLWRKMTRSAWLTVKAGADLVFALLLGGEAVVLLVWLANVLGMPRAEVVVLRTVLARAGGLADLPWWTWAGAWLLLAAASLAFIRWPGRLKNAAERFERWRVVTTTKITQRALTGLHIGLLGFVFVGLAAPPALTPAIGRKLSTAYEVAFQRELLEQGELAAYSAISTELAGQPKSQVLTRLVASIHDISPPEDPQEASSTETDDARRLGEAQALALALQASRSLDPTLRAAAAAAGLTGPVLEPSDLAGRAATVEEQDTKDDDAAKRVAAAADYAAKVVASLISIPQLSHNEVIQVVREYLAGLIEDSPLKDRFAAWIERLPGAKRPPDAKAEVVPVPERLEQAATAELSAEFTAAGNEDPVTDPFATDPALSKAKGKDPLDGAVDIINQARYAQDQSGPCAGCAVPGNSNDNQPGEEPPPEDHPVEP